MAEGGTQWHCGGKLTFNSASKAEHAAMHQSGKHSVRLVPYMCRGGSHGEHWHLRDDTKRSTRKVSRYLKRHPDKARARRQAWKRNRRARDREARDRQVLLVALLNALRERLIRLG